MTWHSQNGSAADVHTAVLLHLADDEFAVGHILTSQSGWGPELEVNLVLSSIGQEELGHARLFYSLFLGEDRDRINEAIFCRPAEQFRSSALAERYVEEWEALVVKQHLYDTADRARLIALADAGVLEQAICDRVEGEETFQRDFWSTWFEQIASTSETTRAHLQAALDDLWPLRSSLFDLVGGTETHVADVLQALDAGRDLWEKDLTRQAAGLQLTLTAAEGAAGPEGRGDRDRMLSELRFVHDEAPGKW